MDESRPRGGQKMFQSVSTWPNRQRARQTHNAMGGTVEAVASLKILAMQFLAIFIVDEQLSCNPKISITTHNSTINTRLYINNHFLLTGVQNCSLEANLAISLLEQRSRYLFLMIKKKKWAIKKFTSDQYDQSRTINDQLFRKTTSCDQFLVIKHWTVTLSSSIKCSPLLPPLLGEFFRTNTDTGTGGQFLPKSAIAFLLEYQKLARLYCFTVVPTSVGFLAPGRTDWENWLLIYRELNEEWLERKKNRQLLLAAGSIAYLNLKSAMHCTVQ